MRYLLMLGYFKDWINNEGEKIPHPDLNEEALNEHQTELIDKAWKHLALHCNVNREKWCRERAPIPLVCACSVCQCVISSALKGLRW